MVPRTPDRADLPALRRRERVVNERRDLTDAELDDLVRAARRGPGWLVQRLIRDLVDAAYPILPEEDDLADLNVGVWVDPTAPPRPEPTFAYYFDPCLRPACGSLNRRLASEPPAACCPRCGGPVLGPQYRRPRVVAIDGDTDAV